MIRGHTDAQRTMVLESLLLEKLPLMCNVSVVVYLYFVCAKIEIDSTSEIFGKKSHYDFRNQRDTLGTFVYFIVFTG